MNITMANEQNLKPLKKGHPGMGGRPKGSVSLTTVLKKVLDKRFDLKNPLTQKKEKHNVKEWLNIALIARAMKGNVPALQMIYDRIEGKVAQQIDANLRNFNVKDMTTEELKEIVDGKQR